MRAWAHLVLCALACSGCNEAAPKLTQVTARIYVEPEVAESMHAVRFRLATDNDGAWTRRELVVVPGEEIERLPFEVPITPSSGRIDRIFELVVEALDADDVPLVQARAITGFVAGEVRVLEMWLELCGGRPLRQLCEADPGCYGTECAVCLGGMCQARTSITPASLLAEDDGGPPDPDKANPQVRPRNACDDRPCDNGGTCGLGNDGGFVCECPVGFAGKTCADAVPCAADPCKNGGACRSAKGSPGYVCQCAPGFDGPRCERVAPCTTEPCQNGGACIADAAGGFSCDCTDGFLGMLCETPDGCAAAPCENGGACSADAEGGFSCDCADGFLGATCETPDGCFGEPCENGGACSRLADGDFSCSCPTGFDGERCELDAPCELQPCENGGSCIALSGERFECACPDGFVGERCQLGCSITPAVGPAAVDEVNLVVDALLFMDGERAGEAGFAGCGGSCAARHAADGRRCGDAEYAPVASPSEAAAGQRFIADWSATGARRIDRIEIYNALGAAGEGLSGAEVRIDGFAVGAYPDAGPSHAILFDPPRYGSSIEVVQTSGQMALAEVEVWGKDEPALRNVALHGATRQSSVLAQNESVNGNGAMLDAGPRNAVDGRFDSVAATKAFSRGGSRDLVDLELANRGAAYPYDTGNADEPPLIGRDEAWWYLQLGRPQRVHVIEIHRGDNPQRLAGAQVFIELGGSLEGTARAVLPAQSPADGMDRIAFGAPLAGVTGVKIVSGIDSVAVSGENPDASLQLREVRVWADPPAFADEPLRDLSYVARGELSLTDISPSNWPDAVRTPAAVVDGNMASGTNSANMPRSYVKLFFDGDYAMTAVDVYKHPSYPSTFYYQNGGCTRLPLCGDTYGSCSRRMKNAVLYTLDAVGGRNGGPLHTFGIDAFERIGLSEVAGGLEFFKNSGGSDSVFGCNYGHESMINMHEVLAFGYPAEADLGAINFAARAQGAAATAEPLPSPLFTPERAINGWDLDYAATGGGGEQRFLVMLPRPVAATEFRVRAPLASDVEDATVEVLIDGGRWEPVAVLALSTDQRVPLEGDRLVGGLRLRRDDDAPLRVRELELLAMPSY